MISLLLAASIVLPVGEVVEVPDFKTRTYPARVVPISRVDVVPQVSGEIKEVLFDDGAHVKRDTPLYRLDHIKYAARVRNGEAKVEECKANLSYAELSYTRHKRLLDTRAVSIDAVDNALSQRDAARAALAAAEAELITARHDLEHCTIVAPISGKLGTTSQTPGNYVTPQSGVLVSIVQFSPIRVRFSMSNRDYLNMFDSNIKAMRENGEVTLKLSNGEDYAEKGVIEYVDNLVDETTDTVVIFVKFENNDHRLRPGGTVQVTLGTSTGTLRPAVSPTSVLQDVQGAFVWVLDDKGIAHRRAILRGDLTGDWVIVEKGLVKGERIVIEGAHKVKKGDVVTPAPNKGIMK
jgi:RND family efflux transporter MFP subunit